MSSMIGTGQAFTLDPAHRGYHVVYREHEANHCPGCSRTHWYVGRTMAECAFCGTALPLEASKHAGQGAVTIQIVRPTFNAEDHAFAA
ncbi:MAG TPA: hypothetical protein VJR87_10865 [Allosphingosinicella sp.]|nr:hypothetical protein [Allosphingosinicella sp.]